MIQCTNHRSRSQKINPSQMKSPEDLPALVPLVPVLHPPHRESEPGRGEEVDQLLFGGENTEVRFKTSVEEQVGEPSCEDRQRQEEHNACETDLVASPIRKSAH